ncbi:MAG: glutamate-1-semialdehyde 2,1-aminomutase [Deltaproteobacteria bacterium]|jgi:glutamate-1-semialdehyde 2,1-aminomutase|nr:glutamate-1-semialdehyde 2,1-aminomutase [Deltaproteobacteria bacterium]
MTQSRSSKDLFQAACRLIPGGVNSPVRACRAVEAGPRFVKKGQGARLLDEDGQAYFDLVGSWGPLIFGHSPPSVKKAVIEALELGATFGAPTARETDLAELVNEHYPSMEMVRLVSSGTEAAMSAVRLARGATGRDKIVKFVGCYHGHADSLLVAAGSGLATFSLPGSLGVPKALAELTITCPYNDLESLTAIFKLAGDQIAAVIVEPVAGNMGLVPPQPDFLPGLAELCRRHGALFICDEVITGFRLGLGGAQALYGLKPDLTLLGKIVGGGLPLAAFGGRRDLMSLLAPLGGVYQAGTLSGNPLAVAAGIAVIKRLQAEPSVYNRLGYMGGRWAEGLRSIIQAKGLAACVNQLGSMSTLFFAPGPITNFNAAEKSDVKLYASWFRNMRERGVWLPPSQFETIFFSAGLLFDEIDDLLTIAEEALAAI